MNSKTAKFTLFVYCNFLVLLSTTAHSKHIYKQTVNIAAFSVSITILNQRIILKDDIEFATEFPCLFVHPVSIEVHCARNIKLQSLKKTLFYRVPKLPNYCLADENFIFTNLIIFFIQSKYDRRISKESEISYIR